jgi:hypothetical protein
MFRTKFVEKITAHISYSVIVLKNRAVCEKMWKILYSGAGHRIQYGACALHAGYQRLQIRTLIPFQQQVCLHEPASMLLVTSTYMTCRV